MNDKTVNWRCMICGGSIGGSSEQASGNVCRCYPVDYKQAQINELRERIVKLETAALSGSQEKKE